MTTPTPEQCKAIAKVLGVGACAGHLFLLILGSEKPLRPAQILSQTSYAKTSVRNALANLRKLCVVRRIKIKTSNGKFFHSYYLPAGDVWLILIELSLAKHRSIILPAIHIFEKTEYVDLANVLCFLSKQIIGWIGLQQEVRDNMQAIISPVAQESQLREAVEKITRYIPNPREYITNILSRHINADAQKKDNLYYAYVLVGERNGKKIIRIAAAFQNLLRAQLAHSQNSDYISGVTEHLAAFEVIESLTCEMVRGLLKRDSENKLWKQEEIDFQEHISVCPECETAYQIFVADIIANYSKSRLDQDWSRRKIESGNASK